MHPSDLLLLLPYASFFALLGLALEGVERRADAIPGGRTILIMVQKGLCFAMIGAPVALIGALALVGAPHWTWQWILVLPVVPLFLGSLAGAYGAVLP